MASKSPIYFHAVALGAFLAASAAPTPLYRFYQEAFAISPATSAVVFAVYAFALLKALLFAGSISDHLGRKPVIFGALLVQIAAMALFLVATGTVWLITARIVQGVATGVAIASIGAALVECDRQRGPLVNSIMPLAGMAVGAFGTSVLIQFGPAPLHLTFGVLLVAFVLLASAIWRIPETTARRPGALASLWPRAAVPRQARRTLLSITPLNIANWTLAGFYLSLVPSLVVATTGNRAPLTGGTVIAVFMLAGIVINFLRRSRSPQTNLAASVFATALGLATVAAGVHMASVALLTVGTLFCGTGFGLNFLGCVGSILPLAKADERAELLAAFYIQSYLAFSLPAILAGFLAKSLGYSATADIYAAAIAATGMLGLAALRTGTHKLEVPASL